MNHLNKIKESLALEVMEHATNGDLAHDQGEAIELIEDWVNAENFTELCDVLCRMAWDLESVARVMKRHNIPTEAWRNDAIENMDWSN